MSEKTTKEILEEIEAERKLQRIGYRKVTCDACLGCGHDLPYGKPCYHCHGKGFNWEAPIV